MATNNTIPSNIAGMTNQQRASLGQGYSNVAGSYNTATGQLNTPSAPVINTATQPIPVNVISNPAPAYTNLPTQTPVAPVVPAPLTFEQYNQQKIAEAQPKADKAYEAYLNAMGLGETQGARTISAEEQAGIPQLQKEFTDVTNQINQKDLEFRRQREAISQEAGLTQAQASAKLADVTRKQNSEMADLEVIRASKSNSLANIQNAVSRKLELQFKDETARIDNLKTIYQDVKGDLTKAEDRKINQLIKQEDAALEQKYREAENVSKFLITAASNGAPASVLNALGKAKTVAEAVRIGGGYAVDPLDRAIKNAQLSKLRQQASGVSPENTVKDTALASAYQLKQATQKTGFKSAVGAKGLTSFFGFKETPIAGTPAADFTSNYDNLKALLSLDNIKLMKGQGQISDGERKTLEQASSQLNRNISEEQFKKILDTTIRTLGGDPNLNLSLTEDEYVNSLLGGSSPFSVYE